jgi:predicted Fe-S protein YdhL (DUF1289 family)
MNVCVLDAERTCTGCRRTLDEIARWGRMSAAEQWAVVARLERLHAGAEGKAANAGARAG